MKTRISQIMIVGLLSLCLSFVVGCFVKSTSRSTLGTTTGDREVKASLDGMGSITSTDEAVTISFVAGKLVIEKRAVRLDGEELAKLPEETKT